MIDLHYIAAPVLGGIIGLFTNEVAIKMLFRPLKPIKIGNFTIPFTPGLIPKEKPRIAEAIGGVVGNNLLDKATLSEALASERIRTSLYEKIDTFIDNLKDNEGTIQDYVERSGYDQTLDQAVAYAGNNLGQYVAEKLVENQVGTQIFEYALQQIIVNLNPMFVVLAESAIEKSKDALLDKLDEMILKDCPEIIDGYLEKEYENWINKPVSEFAYALWQHKDMIKEKGWELYCTFLEKKAGSFLENLDIASVVKEKIQDFDEEELEKMILEIAHKELKALVWIGGVLGTMIGFVNLLF